jgi:AraC family transcriptional regulator
MIKLPEGEYLTVTEARRDFPSARIIETRYTLGQRLPHHSHDHVYMVVMTSGALRESALGREHDLTRGYVVFNGAGEGHHDVVMARGTRCLNVEFSPAFVARLEAQGLPPANVVLYANVGPAIGAVGRLHSALLDPDGQLDVEEALTELVEAVLGPRASRHDDFRWLPRAIEFLHSTFRSGVLLDDMASIAGVHRTHLCRSFRTATGCTIGDYARRLRADLAYQRISTEHAPLAAIAAECGYADQSHMTREVQRCYGCSPASLRRLSR